MQKSQDASARQPETLSESINHSSVVGSFYHVSEKHVDRYLFELDLRLNVRSNPYLFEDTMIRLLKSEPLESKELIDKAGEAR